MMNYSVSTIALRRRFGVRFTATLMLLGAVVGLLAWTLPVSAHAGGVLQLANEPIGAYEISVWTLPDPLRTDEPSHVSMLVLEPAEPGQTDQNFIVDATVLVRATVAGGATFETNATHTDPTDELFYEADLELDQPGTWDVLILIDGELGRSSGQFSVEVEDGAGLNWFVIGGAVLALFAAALLVVWYQRARVRAAA